MFGHPNKVGLDMFSWYSGSNSLGRGSVGPCPLKRSRSAELRFQLKFQRIAAVMAIINTLERVWAVLAWDAFCRVP